MKIFGLILTVFLSGYTYATIAKDDINIDPMPTEMCPQIEKKFFIKEKIAAFEPIKCSSHDATLTFEQNLRFCERTMLRFHNI